MGKGNIMINAINPQEALTLIENGKAILIDVREAEEFAECHIPYALSIPMSVFDKVFHHLVLDAEKTLIFQCKSGGRSGRVCEYMTMIPEGKNNILNLQGGIIAWQECGLTVI
jgi:rhodanese-related sulfurtransferase